MSSAWNQNTTYKSVPAMIAGLKDGELRAGAEMGDVLLRATKDEKVADEILTIIVALLPPKTRRKMLSDSSVPSARVIDMLTRKPRGDRG